uniref:Si:ch211-154o6.3 n=2 Tax=Cyprinus carpio TaxID=7962 RepID=A0A9J8DHF0_CYPCA
MGEVRKLQKKLRQIENLEIKISLTPEEKIKVSKKAELRSRLAELLLQHSGPQQTQGIVGKEEDKMKRQVEEVTEPLVVACRPALKIAREERRENERSDGSQTDGRGATHLPVSPSAEEQEDPEFKSRKQAWEKAKFRLRTLEGHSDIITCAVAVDNLVISGSRDTTVKVWHVPTATEQRNLGGHSGGVTCLSAPPPEYCSRLARVFDLADKERFILSGSTDCCVRIWALSSGQCIKSIYTFNAVSSLCFIPEGEGFIVTGSDAGKLQVWSWSSLENCQSENAHLDAVTTLQSQGPLLFSGSAEGCVCVWEVSDEWTEPLRRLHIWGAEVTGCGGDDGVNGRLILSPRGDRVFLSCGKASIRILNWRTGVMTRLTNHSSTAGVTDCVNQIPGLLIGSCFDIINGESTINLFSLPQCKYLVSLTSSDLPRILCFAAWLTASGDHRWVTGGRNLIVWEQLPGSFKKRGDVTVRRDNRLEDSLLESDRDSEDEQSEVDDDEDSIPQDASETEEPAISSWLRCVLQ